MQSSVSQSVLKGAGESGPEERVPVHRGGCIQGTLLGKTDVMNTDVAARPGGAFESLPSCKDKVFY